MYRRIHDLWCPTNIVSYVDKMEAILPYIMSVHQNSAWATNGYLSRYRMEDVHYGEVGPDRLLSRAANYGHWWCLRGSRMSCRWVNSLPRLKWFKSLRHSQT
jgi:hypothetical protein